MVNERRYRDKLKVVKVIESCNTLEQLIVASRMIFAYETSYNMYSDLLDYTLRNKVHKLQKEQVNEA